ncbi:hypothetical protein ANN_00555 [Periplaneta americana]|uniref:DUF4817 domain-containing protein n=1 Tax=Periplaneta americana TaxID=6978 RepID=A0ABQ8TRB3_PERAM|nr:hypothetical protein ANN_00555 [Periplaneta americana]
MQRGPNKSVKKLAVEIGVSYGSAHKILRNKLVEAGVRNRTPTRLTIKRIIDKFEAHGTICDIQKGSSGRPRRDTGLASSALVLERKVETREALIDRILDAARRIKTATSYSPERRAQFATEGNSALKQKEAPLKMCGNINPRRLEY